MAALMFQVPRETARVLHELEVPGNAETKDPHVTVVYLGKDVPIQDISDMLPVIHEVVVDTLPFAMSTHRVSTFPAGDDGVPVISLVESPELHAFRARLCTAMGAAGVPYDTKFKTYRPHVTLAYAPNPRTEFELDIPEVSWPAHELLLWGSNRGTGRLVVKFPLSLPMAKAATIDEMRERFVAGREAFARGDVKRVNPRDFIEDIKREVLASEDTLQRATVQLAMWAERDQFV